MLKLIQGWFGKKSTPPEKLEESYAGNVFAEISEAVSSDTVEFDPKNVRAVEAPIAPRHENISFARMEEEPIMNSPSAPEPAPRQRTESVKREPEQPNGWDALMDDQW